MKRIKNIIVVPLHEIIDNIYKLLTQGRSSRSLAYFVAMPRERNTSAIDDMIIDTSKRDDPKEKGFARPKRYSPLLLGTKL